LELDYDCSALTLEQSLKQVFSIVNSVKIPSIERHQLTSLQKHIEAKLTEMTENPSNKRAAKYRLKTLKEKPVNKDDSQLSMVDECITAFDPCKILGKK
jgi:hypothetical protein